MYIKKDKNASISHVTTSDERDNITEHHSKQDIEQVLCQENEQKYQQVYDTPTATAPLKNDFGLTGLTNKAKQVAKGTYVPPLDTDKLMKEWFQHMEKSATAKDDKTSLPPMTLAKFQQG